MTRVEALFDDYASYHRTRGNKIVHRFGIPMIMFSLLGLLARIPLWRSGPANGFAFGSPRFPFDAAVLLILASVVYYAVLDWRLAIAMLVISGFFYAVAASLPWWINAAIFVAGWILQFVGHSVYEHRQPAFFRNLQHLLIGPLWILNDAMPFRPVVRS